MPACMVLHILTCVTVRYHHPEIVPCDVDESQLKGQDVALCATIYLILAQDALMRCGEFPRGRCGFKRVHEEMKRNSMSMFRRCRSEQKGCGSVCPTQTASLHWCDPVHCLGQPYHGTGQHSEIVIRDSWTASDHWKNLDSAHVQHSKEPPDHPKASTPSQKKVLLAKLFAPFVSR